MWHLRKTKKLKKRLFRDEKKLGNILCLLRCCAASMSCLLLTLRTSVLIPSLRVVTFLLGILIPKDGMATVTAIVCKNYQLTLSDTPEDRDVGRQ
jgi:hypothetical protein